MLQIDHFGQDLLFYDCVFCLICKGKKKDIKNMCAV